MDDAFLNHPYFTVIIPTYNRPELLARAITSILGQSDPDWELIVVDDASPIEAVAPADPRIRVLRNECNMGKAASINRAFAISHGRVLTILDDDDLFGEDRLKNARLAHAMAMIACCRGREPGPPAAGVHSLTPHVKLVPFRNAPMPSAGALSVAREHWVDLDPEFRACEDIDWVMRLQENCSTLAMIDSPDWVWGRHDGPRHLNGIQARIEGSQRLLDKHKGYYLRDAAAHAERLYRLGVLHRGARDRRSAFALALLSFRRRANLSAVRLALASAFLPFST